MIVIPAKNIDEIKDFYKSVFGWKFEEGKLESDFYTGRIVYVIIPGVKPDSRLGFSGFIMQKKFFGQVPVEYYEVENIDKAIVKVKELNGSIYFEKHFIELHKVILESVIILDANGSPFGLYEIKGKEIKKK